MIDTKVKTQTVTNTQLAVAVAAAFLAGGLAFAAAPAAPKAPLQAGACVLSEASMVYTHAINGTRTLCPKNGYWGARFTCTDRVNDSVSVGNGPCVTQDAILAMARAKCADQTHLCSPRNPVAAATQLSINVDTNYVGLQNDRYALSGTDRFLAGRIKLDALGENINLRDLAILFTPSDASTRLEDIVSSINQINLYSNPNLAEASLISSTNFPVTTSTVVFQNTNYTVTNGVSSYLYIGLRLNSFGTDVDGTSRPKTSFRIGAANFGTNAFGTNSANYISPTIGRSQSSIITITPGKITDVRSNFVGGPFVGGNQNIGSFSITADTGRNTNEFGEPLEINLSEMKLQLSTDVGTEVTTNVSDLQLCRVDSGNCINLEMGSTGLNKVGQGLATLSDTNTTVALVTPQAGTTTTLNLQAFADSNDRKIRSGETVEFVVKGTFMNTVDHFAQVRIVSLDNKGLVYGIDGNDDSRNDYYFYDIRKDAPRDINYPNVVAAPLN